MTERECLADVMGDVQHRQPKAGKERSQVVAEAVAERAVEGAERLVEEKCARLGSKRTCERDPLLLAAGERLHRTLAGTRKTDELEQRLHSRRDLGSRQARHAQPEADVRRDAAVGEEHMLLEHQADPACVGRYPGEVAPVEHDAARQRTLETRDRA